MRLLSALLLLLFSLSLYAQDSTEISGAADNAVFKTAAEFYTSGKYYSTAEELTSIESRLGQNPNQQILGLIYYWRGICQSRLQNYPEAIADFNKALSIDYAPKDIHYELGQALFASDKLTDARLQFRESLKKKFKRGVSLYYIGYISRELGDKNKAYTFFKSIEKLDEEEAKEVRQASEMQIGDLYLEQVEKSGDAFRSVEAVVIPQYRKALELDPESQLAPVIHEKITKLQRKYDLVLFQLRNGRPTLNPPYLLRAAEEIGFDTNVTFSPAGTTVSKSHQGSLFSKTDIMGRYTFYHRDFFSMAPEVRFNSTYYFNRVPEIYRNDNYLIAPAIRTAYEHTLWKKPASLLVDYDYNESKRDVEARKQLQFSSRSHTVMVGERFNRFKAGESIVRLRHRMLQSYDSASNSKMTSLVFEQIKTFQFSTLLFYISYDRMRVETSSLDTDSFTFRTDYILPRYRDWFTPSFSLTLTSTDPINDRSARGKELLFNPAMRLSKTFKKNWRANARIDYQDYQSKDKENFAYKKQIYALELEYLF